MFLLSDSSEHTVLTLNEGKSSGPMLRGIHGHLTPGMVISRKVTPLIDGTTK
jgi:hypothetical protein